MRLLLTGASGFVGSALRLQLLSKSHFELRCAYRRLPAKLSTDSDVIEVGNIDDGTDWREALKGVDVVLHTAAIAHAKGSGLRAILSRLEAVNTQGALTLARQAAEAGVKRFIFLSTVKVNGEETDFNRPFEPDSEPQPVDPYAISKWKAEQGLLEIGRNTGLEVVIVRAALVYGPGVKANFLSMMRWLHRGVPLPFGTIRNRRSLVALDNLIDLIVTCIDHPAAANQTLFVSDGDDLSTSELLRKIGCALHRPARLLPVPSWLLKGSAVLLGKKALSQRLCGSFQVDISKTRELLNWSPPVSVDEALSKTAKHFLEYHTK